MKHAAAALNDEAVEAGAADDVTAGAGDTAREGFSVTGIRATRKKPCVVAQILCGNEMLEQIGFKAEGREDIEAHDALAVLFVRGDEGCAGSDAIPQARKRWLVMIPLSASVAATLVMVEQARASSTSASVGFWHYEVKGMV